MTAKAGASPYEILKDAIAQFGTVYEGIPATMSDAERSSLLYDAYCDLEFQRKRAEAEHKASAADMGGCVLDLSDPDEARAVREALHDRAAHFDRDGQHNVAAHALRIRKRINAGVVRNCERRTEATT